MSDASDDELAAAWGEALDDEGEAAKHAAPASTRRAC